jgi:molybdopterin-guanine dinucleotide biosynthesis protein A
MSFDAIVLAGGRSARFGGVDKAQLVLDGVSLLDRVLRATTGAASTVVVGPTRKTSRPVTWVSEEPPLGGPVAGIAAGLPAGDAAIVVVCSCDLPWLGADDVARLVEGLGEYDGYGLRDTTGREQRLAAAYRRTTLTRALEALGDPRDQAVRHLVSGLKLEWAAPSRAGDDVDTWADLDDSSSRDGPGLAERSE